MAREKKYNMKISNSNKHLLDVFSDDLYLELGSIDYDPLNNLLNKKLVDFKQLSCLEIINKGLGSMNCDCDELSHKLPFIKLNNIVEKNKSCQLVLTYGLLLRRQGYKEHFSPIILIPVKLFFEDDTIYFQMISKPIVNPHIITEVGKSSDISDKLDNINSIDKFIMSFLNNHTHNVRYENYLTVMSINRPEINLRHEKYSIDTSADSKLADNYSVDTVNDYYNITSLDRNQRKILAMASSGNSFAITGYEGTGKTTTLINIAANAIKNGKRVLYISNNDSTLQFVEETFKNVGLNSYVSNLTKSFTKINEKTFEVRKGQILEPVLKNELKQKYERIANIGNCFATKTNNYLLIEVMKELIVTPKPEQLFDEKIMKNSYRLYRHEIDEVLAALDTIELEMKKIPSFINSNFINVPISHNIKDYREPIKLLEKIYLNYCILKEEKDILEKKYGFSKITDYALFINRIKDYSKLNKIKIPVSWYARTNDDNVNIKEQFGNFLRAKELFSQIKTEILSYRDIEKKINDTYTNKVINFDVKNAIDLVTDKYFVSENEKVDLVLKDYHKLESTLIKSLDYCDEIESTFAKLKSRIGFTIDLNNTKIINQILDFIYVLDKGYFSKVWCDYENHDGIYKKMSSIENTIDKYEECLKVYNKYFDNITNLETNIKMLEKKNKDENSKYKKVPIRELLEPLYYIRNHILKIPSQLKEYKDITYAEYKYKVHISDVYKEFIDKHDLINDKNVRIQIEKSFQDLRGSGIVDILTLAKEYRETEKNINEGYQYFANYELIGNAQSLVEKIEQIRSIKKYIQNVVKCQNDMKEILKFNNDEVLFKDYLLLLNNLNTRKNINNQIISNKEYYFLYETLFKGEETNIDELELFINDFSLYIDVFNNSNCLIKSFEPLYNGQIVIHLESAEKIINDINNLFQAYVKMFKTNISKFYYGDFKQIISYFKKLLESKEELRTYLKIADQMKILLKYKLFNLNNFIIYNNHELVKNRFKYSYFLHLYEEYKNSNPEFTKNKNHESLMESILFLEKDLIDNNREIVRLSNKNFRYGKASNLNYNQYIEKNNKNKMLFLADTPIANQYLSMDLFDLAIIDDAQLLHPNEYHKVITVKQVVLGGTEQIQTSMNNNLISRMRPSNLVKLKYKYKKTPLKLLQQFEGTYGRFYSDIEQNNGVIITTDDYNSVLIDLYKSDNNCKINFFTSSLSIMHDLIKNIGSVLYDKELTVQEIYSFFKYNLNISDLTIGYLLDSDYNVLYLDSYNEVNNEVVVTSMINNLLSCGKKLIIIDTKNHLKEEKQTLFVSKLNEIINYNLPKCVLQENSVIANVSKSLSRFQIKTRMVSLPLHFIVEYDKKYFGILLYENPSNTEFTLLNEFREFKSCDFPIVVVWLSQLVEDYNRTINEIVKEIRS